MPAHGHWQITLAGENRLLEWVSDLFRYTSTVPHWENNLNKLAEIDDEEIVIITHDTIIAAQEAYRLAQKLFPSRIPEASKSPKVKLAL